MASDSIGSGALVLSVQAGQLNAGLQKAQNKIGAFFGTSIGGLSVFAGGWTGAFLAIGNAISSYSEKIDASVKTARTLGISHEVFAGLAHGADLSGISAETLSASLSKLTRNISEASDKGSDASTAFTSLGLSAQELAKLPVDESMGKIADALLSVDNVYKRAALAQDIFGKGSEKLMPLLAEGSAGINAFVTEAKKLGGALSDVDAAKIENANDSMSRVKLAFEGVLGKLVVAFAPALEAIGKAIVDMVEFATPFLNILADYWSTEAVAIEGLLEVAKAALSGIADMFSPLIEALGISGEGFGTFKEISMGALKSIATGLSYWVDIFKMTAGAAMTYLVAPLTLAFGEILTALQALLEAAGKLPDRFGGSMFRDAAEGLGGFKEKVDAVAEAAVKKGDELMATPFGESKKAVDDFFKRIEERGNAVKPPKPKPIDTEALENHQKMMAEGKKIAESFRTPAQIFAEEIKQLDKLLEIGALGKGKVGLEIYNKAKEKALNKRFEEGNKIKEDMKSPIEKYEDEIKRLDKLLAADDITGDTFGRAKQKAGEDFLSATDKSKEIKSPEALLRGSREALSAIITARITGPTESKEERLQRVMEEQRNIQRLQLIEFQKFNRGKLPPIELEEI